MAAGDNNFITLECSALGYGTDTPTIRLVGTTGAITCTTLVTTGAITAGGGLTFSGAQAVDSLTVGGGYGVTGTTISGAGVITTNGALTSDGVIQSGKSGAVGGIRVYPTTASKGYLDITVTDQATNAAVSLVVDEMAAARTIHLPDPGATAYVVMTSAALDLAEANVLQGATAGTAVASKALVVDASIDIGTIRNLTATGTVQAVSLTATGTMAALDITVGGGYGNSGLTIGNSGAVTTDATIIAEGRIQSGKSGVVGAFRVYPATVTTGYAALTCADQAGDTAVSIVVDQMAAARTIHLPDPGATGYLVMTSAALDLAEADVLQGATAGTAVASKALVVDASIDIGTLRNVTATGTIQGASVTATGTLTGLDAAIGGGFTTGTGSGLTVANTGALSTNGAIITESTLASGVNGANGHAGGLTINNGANPGAATFTVSSAGVVYAASTLAVGGVVTLGADTTTALLLGAGAASNATVITTATANKNFIQFYTENTATSGDNRGIYNRFYLGGAGGGGESLRSYTTVDDVAAGTAHGAHLSLNFATSGSITGLGVAMRGTLHVPNYAMSAGTYAALQAEAYCDGTSSDISGVTAHGLIRCVVDGGDATAQSKVTKLLLVSAPVAAKTSAYMVANDDVTGAGGAAAGGIQVSVNGTAYWIALYAI